MVSTNRGLLPELSKLRVAPSQAMGYMTLENPGDADALPIWEVRGPGNNFQAISPSGEVLHWEGTLVEGEIITIDASMGTVIDNFGNNRYADLAPSPRMWTIPPGKHECFASLDNTSLGHIEPFGPIQRTNWHTNPGSVTTVAHADGTLGVATVAGHDGALTFQDTANSGPSGYSTRIAWPGSAQLPSAVNYPSATKFPSNGIQATPDMSPYVVTTVENLVVGKTYTAIARVWSSATAPDVHLRVASAGVTGSRTSVKGAHSTLRATFVATDTTMRPGIYPMTDVDGGNTWVSAWAVIDGEWEGEPFDGNTASSVAGYYEWTAEPNLSPSAMRSAELVGASRVAVSWRPRRWLVI